MNTRLQLVLSLAAALGASAFTAQAAPLTFDFKDPKGVNNVVFRMDAPLESINGTGTGISGAMVFDPANPAATTGTITLATSSLAVGNPLQSEHMHGAMWLDVANHPTISFEAVRLANVKTTGDQTAADVTGKLTVKGVTKEVTVPVTFTYLPGKLGARVPKTKGDLLVVRASFEISRREFGINGAQMEEKVSDAIALTLAIAGAAPTP